MLLVGAHVIGIGEEKEIDQPCEAFASAVVLLTYSKINSSGLQTCALA